MNKHLKIACVLMFVVLNVSAQSLKLSLNDVIEMAKAHSPSAKIEETRKETQYWAFRQFKSNYNPGLYFSGDLPGYNRDFNQNLLDNGEYVYQPREQLSSSLGLWLEQPIAATGGTVSINSRINQIKNITYNTKGYNNTLFNIQLFQPIFGFNELKWDKQTEPLRYEESRRSYVEEMEAISQRATELYFDYLTAQIDLQIAKYNLANNDTIYNIQQGRYNIGTSSRDELLQVELQLLTSRQGVTQASLDMKTTKLRLASYIGLQGGANSELELLSPQELPEFDIPLEQAILYAKQNRADYIAFERSKLEAKREVDRARSQRFQTNLNASFGLNKAGTTFSDSYSDPNDQQRVNVSLSFPILDWGRSKSRVQIALAQQQLSEYTLAQGLQNFEQEIITNVSQFEVLRAQVEIAKKSDEVAQERYDVTQNRYLIGKNDITNLNIALKEKDEKKRSYLSALRAFWTAYFELRRLTLYDFLNDELLYQIED
ncbi:TolC family protein [Reichenbachiella sp. MALMAid0571]|uniref:TolC family protein n=1 Tax=Reichenbachiella sp. MALMAid0571 TaxID=3143939 RepID=UPI0032DF7D83